MTEETAKATSEPLSVDVQDPLPESNWFWRRVFIFGLTMVLIVGAWWLLSPMRVRVLAGDKTAILGVFDTLWYAFGLILVNQILYTVAPSGEQVVKMFNLSSILTKGAGWMNTAAATSSTGETVHVQSKAGSVAAPAAASEAGAPSRPPLPPSAQEALTGLAEKTGLPAIDGDSLPWRKGGAG